MKKIEDPYNPDLEKMKDDIKTNHVAGQVQLDSYAGSDINLTGWKITSVIDDVLLIKYVDESEDGRSVIRGGIHLPTDISKAVWRIGQVVLAGPRAKIKAGQHVMFPNDKGLPAKNINGIKRVIFLNEERIFGVVEPD